MAEKITESQKQELIDAYNTLMEGKNSDPYGAYRLLNTLQELLGNRSENITDADKQRLIDIFNDYQSDEGSDPYGMYNLLDKLVTNKYAFDQIMHMQRVKSREFLPPPNFYIPPNPFMPAGGWVYISPEHIPGNNSPFEQSDDPWRGAEKQSSPIVLDLDGDGIETVGKAQGAYFDHDVSGFAENTGWISGDDGILTLDRNGDGIINDGTELFGDHTRLASGANAVNGFQALAELDENGDGKIDNQDAAYSQLRIWKDIDGDGYSMVEELLTLEEAGVKSLRTSGSKASNNDAYGNTEIVVSSYEKLDGTTANMSDYNFAVDTIHTVANAGSMVEVPEAIMSLPYLQGFGNVDDLWQAMAKDNSGELAGLVQSFIAEPNPVKRGDILEQLLAKWSGSEAVAPGSRGNYIDAV